MDSFTSDQSKMRPYRCQTVEEEPRDLSMKRRMRTVPPPLDLTIKTLDVDNSLVPTFSPRSPASQKYLPLRKRTLSWCSQQENIDLNVQNQNTDLSNSNYASECHSELNISGYSSKWSCLPTPQTPTTPHPSSAIPVSTDKFVFGDHSGMESLHQPLNLSTGSVNGLPSSLLSPAPSHLSSSPLSSSREELEAEPQEMKFSPFKPVSPVWSIFHASVQVFFMNGQQLSSPRMAEDLSQMEKGHPPQHRYAPNGLKLMQIIPIPSSPKSYGQLYFRPIMADHQDIVALVPNDHLFYVSAKGWCSLLPHNKMAGQLQEGDQCLPHTHPEVVQMPNLAEAMQKFDFNDETTMEVMQTAPVSASFVQNQRFQFLSPPASPSKKKGETTAKARRPMNGFMLYAKEHRPKLIQECPGKDNRAISVILGNLWKSLHESKREIYIAQARHKAEQRKLEDPDCWKRKRSHSTS